jgi:hypothetical protein
VGKHKEKLIIIQGTRGLTSGMELMGSIEVVGEVGATTSVAGGLEAISDKSSTGPHMVINARCLHHLENWG